MVEHSIYIFIYFLSLLFVVKLFHKVAFKKRIIEMAGYTFRHIHVFSGTVYVIIVTIITLLTFGRIMDFIYILSNSN